MRRLFLLVLLAAVPLAAQPAPSDLASHVDALATAEQQRLKIPGMAVAVAVDGALVYDKAFGTADLENGAAAKTTTAFRTASVAKPMTATAVLQLVEKGQIDLDAPIERYCAAFPRKPWPVTARHLLGHLAGVRHYTRPRESSGTTHYFAVADSLKLFADDPLLHEPGTKYEYSTYGFSVLGCAIEGASKTTYRDYMQAHVFDPARMTRTGIDELYMIVRDRARGYQLLTEDGFKSLPPAARATARPGEIYNADLHDTSMKTPGGGLYSTASDLVRFALALRAGSLVSPASLDRMWTSQKTASGEETGYGMGWGVRVDKGIRTVSHGGNQAGAASVLGMVPDRGVVVAVMTNLEDADIAPLARGIRDAALTRSPSTAPAAPASRLFDAEVTLGAQKYVGTFDLRLAGARVAGSMKLVTPVEINGEVNGTVSGRNVALDFPYDMPARPCSGRAKIAATLADDGSMAGTIELAVGPCAPKNPAGTITLRRQR